MLLTDIAGGIFCPHIANSEGGLCRIMLYLQDVSRLPEVDRVHDAVCSFERASHVVGDI